MHWKSRWSRRHLSRDVESRGTTESSSAPTSLTMSPSQSMIVAVTPRRCEKRIWGVRISNVSCTLRHVVLEVVIDLTFDLDPPFLNDELNVCSQTLQPLPSDFHRLM